METQPQLLLLQKTMLTAEGTGRKLNPQANMWMMSKPLVENWMVSNLGPEARLIDTAKDVSSAIRRLPRLIKNLDQTAQELSEGRLRLHPDTIRALNSDNYSSLSPLSVLTFAILICGLLALSLFFY